MVPLSSEDSRNSYFLEEQLNHKVLKNVANCRLHANFTKKMLSYSLQSYNKEKKRSAKINIRRTAPTLHAACESRI